MYIDPKIICGAGLVLFGIALAAMNHQLSQQAKEIEELKALTFASIDVLDKMIKSYKQLSKAHDIAEDTGPDAKVKPITKSVTAQ